MTTCGDNRWQLSYKIEEVVGYINWIYFYHAWQVQPGKERDNLRADAEKMIGIMKEKYRTHAVFALYEANSDGDDLLLNGERLPLLRQQTPDEKGCCLCLADFVRPLSSGITDRVGAFATTVDMAIETDFHEDPFQKMMAQTIADRLAEATAELMHLQVRKHYWGYAPDEQLTVSELHKEHFQGIRPAVGYPSLPDTSVNFILDRMLGMKDIGITLTETGAMRPHASVSGLMISHPSAHYFNLGKIDEVQLADYARRRGVPEDMMRRFLAASLLN